MLALGRLRVFHGLSLLERCSPCPPLAAAALPTAPRGQLPVRCISLRPVASNHQQPVHQQGCGRQAQAQAFVHQITLAIKPRRRRRTLLTGQTRSPRVSVTSGPTAERAHHMQTKKGRPCCAALLSLLCILGHRPAGRPAGTKPRLPPCPAQQRLRSSLSTPSSSCLATTLCSWSTLHGCDP